VQLTKWILWNGGTIKWGLKDGVEAESLSCTTRAFDGIIRNFKVETKTVVREERGFFIGRLSEGGEKVFVKFMTQLETLRSAEYSGKARRCRSWRRWEC
jgi:hypothetical protein